MKNTIYFLVINLFITVTAFGQVRPDLNNDFNASERGTLVTLMQQYITKNVIENHCDYVALSGESDIHDDFNFMPFHRVYLEGMEDFFMLNNHPEFVPLPSWDPSTSVPPEFQVVDSDCLATNCNNGVVPGSTPAQYCSSSINWNPNINIPNYLSNLCNYSFSPTVPAGINVNGLSRKLETPYHNSVHGAMGGNMSNFSSPSSPIFWVWHAYLDDMWKEWECNCPQSTTKNIDLYIKDNAYVMQNYRDRGEEPNIDNGPMWLSDDIWVRNQQDGFTNDTHQNPEYSATNKIYVYVRVRNRGCLPSDGTETLSLHWAKAATALSWPLHWEGNLTTPALMGDIISVENIPITKAQSSSIVEFEWLPPNPDDYNGINNEPWHFCLLARQISSIDPMTFPEVSDLNLNVLNNNNIGWKNITIVDNLANFAGGSTFNVENIFEKTQLQTIEISVANHQESLTEALLGNMTLKLGDNLMEKVEKNEDKLQNLQLCGDELIFTGLPASIPVDLKPKETGQMHLGFNLENIEFPEPIQVNVIQRVVETGAVVGGVTYIVSPQLIEKEQDTIKLKLNSDTYGVKEVYNWYSHKGKILYKNDQFGFPKEINQYMSIPDLSKMEFPFSSDLVKLKIESIKTVKFPFIDWFSKRTKFNNECLKVSLGDRVLSESVLMIFNPYGEIVNNYLIEAGTSEVLIKKMNLSEGENHFYLVELGHVTGSGTIKI